MSTISIGRKREKPQISQKTTGNREANILFGLGSAVICLMLVLTMSGGERENKFASDAVPVMSGGVVGETSEELVRPDRDTSADVEDWSIYDYIGQMFADLLFGDR